MMSLLNGVRVLDFTSIVLGPYATKFLGDFGAEVIKIEPVHGDLFRSVRPGRSRTMGAGFLNINRNKRSLAIDLKHSDAREVVHALVAHADVVVHNMRPNSAAHLGLSYEALTQINPNLVYAYAPGFDQRGPNADEPAYDDIIQAQSGLARLNANSAGEPRYLASIVCDKVGGLHLAMAVLAALTQRARSGKGCAIEAPMFESMVSFLLTEQLGGETFVPPLGSTGYERLSSPNRRPFPTRDDYVAILPYTTIQWVAFFKLIGRPEQGQSTIVQDPVLRSENIDTLYSMIAAVTPERTTAEWLEALRAIDVPCARVNRIDELLSDPHLATVGMFRNVHHPSEGALRSVHSPFHVPGMNEQMDTPPPNVGADSLDVLAAAGLSRERIDHLIASGVVGAA